MWCWLTQVFHKRKNFSENCLKFGQAPSKMFASPVIGRESWKNVSLLAAPN